MISGKFMSLSDEVLARFIENTASDEEVQSIMDSVQNGSDLYLLTNIVQSVKDDF